MQSRLPYSLIYTTTQHTQKMSNIPHQRKRLKINVNMNINISHAKQKQRKIIPWDNVMKRYGKSSQEEVHFRSPFMAPSFAVFEVPRYRYGGVVHSYEIHICLNNKYSQFQNWVQQKCEEKLAHVYEHKQYKKGKTIQTKEDFLLFAKKPIWKDADGNMWLKCTRHGQHEGPITIWKKVSNTFLEEKVQKRYGRETLMQFTFQFEFWQIKDYGISLRFDEHIVIKDNQ